MKKDVKPKVLKCRKELAILKGLVAVAWADGNINEKEIEIINEYCIQFQLTKKEISDVHSFLANPPEVDDLPSLIPLADDRLFLISQAYIMACADEGIAFKEIDIINRLVDLFGLSKKDYERAQEISIKMFRMVLSYRNKKSNVSDIVKSIAEGEF